MDDIFYVFGSPSSADYDILVLVGNVPETYAAHEWCDEFTDELKNIFTDKKINVNLGVMRDGIIVKVFKGTPDEVNNSVFMTYAMHKQKHPLGIMKLVPRDYHLKLLRTARVILSFLSRTKHRLIVKDALKGDLNDKIAVLKAIDLNTIKDLADKNCTMQEFYKICAFQFGQCFGLASGIEFYTKEAIAEKYPEFKDALGRSNLLISDIIEQAKRKFIVLLEQENGLVKSWKVIHKGNLYDSVSFKFRLGVPEPQHDEL